MFGIHPTIGVGITLSDATIEAVALTRRGRRVTLLRAATAPIPDGLVVHGRIVNQEQLATVVQQSIDQLALPAKERVVFGVALPDVHVYVASLTVPETTRRAVAQAIPHAIAKTIPLDPHDTRYRVEHRERHGDDVGATIVAASDTVMKEWFSFFSQAGYPLTVFDIEPAGILRSVVRAQHTEPVCVVDIGSRTTNITILRADQIVASAVLHIAGNACIDAIGTKHAQTAWEEHGLAQKTKKATAAVERVVTALGERIKEVVERFETSAEVEVREILCLGGVSQAAGVTDHLSTVIGRPVAQAQSRFGGKDFPPSAITAAGVAARLVERTWRDDQYVIAATDPRVAAVPAHSAPAPSSTGETSSLPRSPRRRPWGRVVALLSVLLLAVVALVGAVWYRAQTREARQSDRLNALQQLDQLDAELAALEAVQQEVDVTSTPVFVLRSDVTTLDLRLAPSVQSPTTTMITQQEQFSLVTTTMDGWYFIERIGDMAPIGGWVPSQFMVTSTRVVEDELVL